MEWLVSSRIEFLHSMKDGHPTKYFAAHLPVMATWNEEQSYPVNMTVKGVGLLPNEDALQHYTDHFESVIAEARSMPWKESMHMRLNAISKLYGDIDNFDTAALGGLEIFGGKALENLRGNSSASLLYVGMSEAQERIQYISFQINSTVTILEKEDPYYSFLLASRKLFEFDKFHLYQPDYPFGYLIKVAEVIDKSPWSRKPGRQ
jgi:hypothetical protein